MAKQSLTPGQAFDPALGLMGEDEAQMPDEHQTVIARACTRVPCGKVVCSPGSSDMDTYHRISLY